MADNDATENTDPVTTPENTPTDTSNITATSQPPGRILGLAHGQRAGIGRLVHYQYAADGSYYSGLITHVHDDGSTVDLVIFGRFDLPSLRHNVAQANSGTQLERWRWPELR